MHRPLIDADQRSARRTLALPVGLFAVMLAILSACYGPPPTDYVIITDTPNGSETPTLTPTPIVTVIVVTATSQPGTSVAVAPSLQPTQEVQPTTSEISSEDTGEPSTVSPTATFNRVYMAEQTFENGRMFWLEPIEQIWVMVENADDKRSGMWMVFGDDFDEGDQEFDPSIRPPRGLFQPERGFGLLWRENEEVRSALGWATQTEIGHVSDYQYQPAGTFDDADQFIRDPGYHIVTSGYGNKTFRFNEVNGTWQTLRDEPDVES